MFDIEQFLVDQYLLSDSGELDFWIAYLARNAGLDWLAEIIEETL